MFAELKNLYRIQFAFSHVYFEGVLYCFQVDDDFEISVTMDLVLGLSIVMTTSFGNVTFGQSSFV
jgi:hypothetical protein